MSAATKLWTLCLSCQAEQISLIEEAFEGDCVVFSILEEPNATAKTVEILVDQKPDTQSLHARMGILTALSQTPDKAISFQIKPIGNLDWIKKVCENFAPLPIARWTIYGAAYREPMKKQKMGLQIDATSAFGTGEHPTTRGCLMMLDELLSQSPKAKEWRMLDIGCGSGILAMAFAKATKGQAFGVDMDETSVAIAQNNLRENRLGSHVRFEIGTGYAHPMIAKNAPYDLIMANVFADPLCEMASDLKKHLKRNGVAILSGLLHTQAPRVLAAHRQQGLKLVKRMRIGDWSVLALTHASRAS